MCMYELKMHRRFVGGRKQLIIDGMRRLWKVAEMERFGHVAITIAIQKGKKCPKNYRRNMVI